MRKKKQNTKKADMDIQNIQSGHGGDGESKAVTIKKENDDEIAMVEVWIKDIIRVKPSELPIIKKSYETWANQWE